MRIGRPRKREKPSMTRNPEGERGLFGPISGMPRRQFLAGAAALGAASLVAGRHAFAQEGGNVVVYSTTHPAI